MLITVLYGEADMYGVRETRTNTGLELTALNAKTPHSNPIHSKPSDSDESKDTRRAHQQSLLLKDTVPSIDLLANQVAFHSEETLTPFSVATCFIIRLFRW